MVDLVATQPVKLNFKAMRTILGSAPTCKLAIFSNAQDLRTDVWWCTGFGSLVADTKQLDHVCKQSNIFGGSNEDNYILTL